MVNHYYDDNPGISKEDLPPDDFHKKISGVRYTSAAPGLGTFGSKTFVVGSNQFAYKYSEGKSIEEFSKYIRDTYGAHYKGENNIQAFDIWEARTGDPTEVHSCTGMKYLFRYGKKYGYNRDDILKTMHYCLMLLHYHDKFHKENK